MAPAPQGVRRRRTVALGIPAFHRMNAPAIADREIADFERPRQGRASPRRQDSLVERQLQTQFVQSGSQSRDVFELGDLGILQRSNSRTHGSDFAGRLYDTTRISLISADAKGS